MEKTYICPTCRATKTLVKTMYQTWSKFIEQLPASIPCGWRGCTDLALPKDN